jgi:anaerobic selenocysteine-containing dehydrogenase
VSDNPCDETGVIAHEEDFGVCTNPDVRNLEHVDTIIIFGRNARVVNQHLYSYLKHLKKEIIYIDPIKSETAKIAKKYIRINPATDGILCNHILGSLGYIKNFLNLDETIKLTGISREDIEFLKSKIKPKKTGLITGFGLQRYSNGKNIVQWINRLAYYTDNLDTLYYGKSSSAYLSGISVNKKNKITIKEAYDRLKTGYFDLVVIVAANPLVTYPETNFLKKIFDNVNLVTIDTNLTDTVDKSNIFIKVGGMFAQDDILGSYFFDGVMNKRERFLDTISDTDVVKMLSEKFDFQIKVKSIDEINYEKKALRRNFTKDEIGISLPIMGNGLRLISNSHSLYLNSQLAEDEIAEEFLHISPDDAYKFDINDGDMVELFNEYGNLKIHAKITDKVAKGYVMVYKNKKYFGNTPNILTKMSQTDAGMAVAYYDTFVNIRRAE